MTVKLNVQCKMNLVQLNLTLTWYTSRSCVHEHRQRRQGAVTPWIFIHDTDKVEGGLMMLFFGLVFSVGSLPGNFSAEVLALAHQQHTEWQFDYQSRS